MLERAGRAAHDGTSVAVRNGRFEREILRDDAEIEGNTNMHRRSCSIEVSRSAVRGTAPARSRRVVRLATCAAGLFLPAWAPDALAQSTSKSRTVDKNFTASPTSSCTGEVVSVEGTQTIQTRIQPVGSNTRFTFKDHQYGKGVGQVSLAPYKFDAISQDMSVESSTCQFYVRKTSNEHLIRQGQRPPRSDDFFARSRFLLKMTTDCQTQLTFESFEAAECK